MSERVSDKDLREMLDVMDEGESYLPEADIEAALRDLVDARSGKALKDAHQRIAELEAALRRALGFVVTASERERVCAALGEER